MRRAVWFALALIVAGCSNDPSNKLVPKDMLASLKSLTSKKPDTAPMRAAVEGLTRKQLIGVATDPMILVDIEATDLYATLNQIEKNGQNAVFMSGDQKTLTFSKGLLVATRGLGADLMSLDVTETRAALAHPLRKSTNTTRTHRYLTADNHIEALVFHCALIPKGSERLISIHKSFTLLRFDEHCTSEGATSLEYTNTYWMQSAGGVMWKSRQWVGPVVGYLGVEAVIPEKS